MNKLRRIDFNFLNFIKVIPENVHNDDGEINIQVNSSCFVIVLLYGTNTTLKRVKKKRKKKKTRDSGLTAACCSSALATLTKILYGIP